LHRAGGAHVIEHPARAAVPSKQVNAKTLPITNLRASSAFICPARAGVITAPAVTAPNTKRASML
jgi:hypothetical protein